MQEIAHEENETGEVMKPNEQAAPRTRQMLYFALGAIFGCMFVLIVIVPMAMQMK